MKVIALTRVSTQEQAADDRAGIARQRAEIKRATERWGLEIVREISLADVSGADVLATPEFRELRSDLQRPEISGIVVADLDRLYRPDRFTDLAIMDDFKDNQKQIFTPEQVIEPFTQSGFLVGGISSIIAGHDRMNIKRRMLGAKEVKRRQGKCPNSCITLPTGVAWDKQREKFYYTEKANAVRQAFHLVVSGIPNLREVERQTGLHHRALANILRNPIYTGMRVYTHKRGPQKYSAQLGRQGDRKKIARAAHEIIAVRVIDEQLVSAELFGTVQQVLRSKKDGWQHQRRRKPHRFSYVGFVYCDACGQNCYTVSGELHGRKDYYACKSVNGKARHACKIAAGERRYMPRPEVDATIDSFVSEHLACENFLGPLLTAYASGDSQAEEHGLVSVLAERIRALKKRKKNLISLFGDDLIRREDLDEQIVQVNDDLQAAEKSYEEQVKKQALHNGGSLHKVCRDLCQVFSEFPFLEPSQKRQVLQRVMPRVYLRSSAITKVELRLSVEDVGTRMGTGSWLRPA